MPGAGGAPPGGGERAGPAADPRTATEAPPVVDKELLEILACPESMQPLRMATPEELEQLNARARDGAVLNRGGKPLKGPLSEALVRQDAQVLYPIRDGIPVLLVDEGVELSKGKPLAK